MISQLYAKYLIALGLIIAAIGAILFFAGQFKWLKLGRLPGDIYVQRDGFTFMFPVTSIILLSVVLTLVLWLVSWFRR